jgi:amidase
MTRAAGKSSAFVPHDLAAPIEGRSHGPLAGFTAAVKDMYDIAGERTGAGNPDWLASRRPAAVTARAVARLLDAGASVIGKTVCDEFLFSLVGNNAHYGTPINPRALGHVPGGSSSGSAAATAAGACDIGLGSDTGGSIRVPASFCGLYSLRPTHGRVDTTGAMAMAPSFDAVGWITAAPGLLRLAGSVLLEGESVRAPVRRLLVAKDCFAHADAEVRTALGHFLERASARLPRTDETIVAALGFAPWREAFRVIQGRELWTLHGDFMTAQRPALGPGIRERIGFAATVTAAQDEAARAVMRQGRAAIRLLLPPGSVLALPTTPCIAPSVTATELELDHFRLRAMELTCIAGIAGLPQVTLPAGTVSGCPVGISFIGWAGGDEALLDLAVMLARFCCE